MEAQIELFLQSLVANNRSPHTVAAYQGDLSQFTRFVQETSRSSGCKINGAQDVDPAIVRRFPRAVQSEFGLSPASIARKIAAVRSLFRFLRERGELALNPLEGLQSPIQSGQSLRPLRIEETARLLASPQHSRSHYPLRDRAILELLCSVGLRQTEMIALTVADLDLAGRRITCGAGKKRRTLPLEPDLAQILARFFEEERPRLLSDHNEESVFLNHLGRPLTRQGVWLIVQRHAKLAQIDVPVTPLVLRRTYAVRHVAAGADARLVQKRLGLASAVSATAYYQAGWVTQPELEIDGVSVSPLNDAMDLES